MTQHYDVAAYVWPSYTGDEPRSRIFWPQGFGEWQSVQNAVSKFPGHSWPRKPLWGYVNEADPYVMEMQINAAADHGVNVFIYDWYWYDRRPFLEQCLNNGFLKARNRDRMRFYLMWANHNATNTWDIRTSGEEQTVIWDGGVDLATFEPMCKRLISRYFTDPCYYKIQGKPVFMIYDLATLIRGLGGREATTAALAWFKQEVRAAGFPDLHLQLVKWGGHRLNLSGVDQEAMPTLPGLAEDLGFNSLTHYQFVHFTDMDREYQEILGDVEKEWRDIEEQYRLPYAPHVSIGWDNNPRFHGFRPVVTRGNTPALFEKALEMAKAYVDRHPGQAPLITLNSWNEWTETSYLQPDNLYGYGYLKAVRNVFQRA